MTSGRPWTEEEHNVLREYYPQGGSRVVAEMLGRTRYAVIARASFLGLCYVGRRKIKDLTDEQRQWIADHFPTMVNREVAEHIGLTPRAIERFAARNGITKDPEWLLQYRRRLAAKGNQSLTAEHYKRISATRRETYRKERARVLYGMKQQTRMKVSFTSQQKHEYLFRMRRKGYIEVEGDRSRLYYDDSTKRSKRSEGTAAKHFIKILPIEALDD